MDKLQYQFNDAALLDMALTHRSVSGPNNERLEFLGDAVLGLVIAQELFARHPDAKEGELSRMRSALVRGETLAKLAKDLKMPTHLNLGAGELKNGGQHRQSILADAMEAVIGAVYLDSDFVTVKDVVLALYGNLFEGLSLLESTKDPKSQLQEYTQANKLPLPKYNAKITGEAHAQTFHVSCEILTLPHLTTGESSSRRKAEQIAAEKYLELLDANN